MKFKYSITLSSFRDIKEPLEKTLERLIHQKYNAVEMFGEPYDLDLKYLNDIFCSFEIPVCGITGMWGARSEDGRKRNLLSSNKEVLACSEQYVKDCVKMCNLLGGYEVNICLFADDEFVPLDRNHTLVAQAHKVRLIQKIAIPTLSRLAKYSSDYGIQLLLEPLNRYSTPYCTTAKDAIDIASQINQDNFGLLLDSFHMNIEEDSMEAAIMESCDLLRHIHLADNNRKMPGDAHINFESIIRPLNAIEYDKYISFEPILTKKEYEIATK
ncbi:MAG: sugar phosphate isomerase/epimerase, partial [Candidatus Nitrosopolaris sp.]